MVFITQVRSYFVLFENYVLSLQAAQKEQWSTMFQTSTTTDKQPSQMQRRIEEEMRKIEEKRNARSKLK